MEDRMNLRLLERIGIAAALLALGILVSGCGSGIFGQLTEEEKAQEAWSDSLEEQAAHDQAPAPSEAPATSDGEVMEYAEGEQVLIWKAGNDGAIEGYGGTPPKVVHDRDYYVVEIATYHAGYGSSNAPDPSGTISLKAADGTVYGPYSTTVRNFSYWIATPNEVIPAGTYTLIDSDPSTWAQNTGSGGTGMGWAYGVIPE
jgi:hypothetical protein